MKKLFFLFTFAALLCACGDSDAPADHNTDSGNPSVTPPEGSENPGGSGEPENPGNPGNPESLIATWELVREQGYESYDSFDGPVRDEWEDKSPDFDASYLFRKDGTGLHTTIERFEQEAISTNEFAWDYAPDAATLTLRYTFGDQVIYHVEELSAATLVLTRSSRDDLENYAYFNRETYARK